MISDVPGGLTERRVGAAHDYLSRVWESQQRPVASSASSAGTPSRWQAVVRPAQSQAYWGNVVVPDWLLCRRSKVRNPCEEARAHQLAAARSAKAKPSDTSDRLRLRCASQSGASEPTAPMPLAAAPEQKMLTTGCRVSCPPPSRVERAPLRRSQPRERNLPTG